MSSGPATSPTVAIFLPSLAGGGAERAMVNLARGLSELGRSVDLVLGDAAGPYRGEVPDAVRIVDLGASRVTTALPGLVRYLRRSRPACLIAALDHANVVAIVARGLARVPTRVMVSIRDMVSPQATMDPGTLRARLVALMMPALYRRADAIVAVSAGVADDAADALHLDRRRIVVVPNPVLTPALAGLAAAPLEHPWLAPGMPPVVLACGRLVRQKGFDILLPAFARVAARRPARLVILGEGPDRAALEAQAREIGIADAVAMPGFEANPFRFMARARLFVLSSRREGSPNVLVQALACGCPVVATDCPSGPREILALAGCGRLVGVGEVEALAEAMLAALDEPRPATLDLGEFHYLTSAARYLAAAGA